MSATRKPRADSVLKTLPEERQEAIAALLASKTLQEVRAELRKDGIVTSSSALSEFWSWWQLRAAMQRREARVSTMIEELRTKQPSISEADLFEYGQSLFGQMAIAEEDTASWYRTQRLALAKTKLDLERRRIEVLESQLKKVQQAVTEAKSGGLTPETLTKIEEAARLL